MVASSQYISRRDENGTRKLQDLADSPGPYALFPLLLLGTCSHHTHQVPLGTTEPPGLVLLILSRLENKTWDVTSFLANSGHSSLCLTPGQAVTTWTTKCPQLWDLGLGQCLCEGSLPSYMQYNLLWLMLSLLEELCSA